MSQGLVQRHKESYNFITCMLSCYCLGDLWAADSLWLLSFISINVPLIIIPNFGRNIYDDIITALNMKFSKYWCFSSHLGFQFGFKIDLLVSEPYFISSLLPWHSLYFWYSRTALRPHLAEKVTILPRAACLRAIAVQFEHLWKFHAPVGDLEGFDVRIFDNLTQVIILEIFYGLFRWVIWDFENASFCFTIFTLLHLIEKYCDFLLCFSCLYHTNKWLNQGDPLSLPFFCFLKECLPTDWCQGGTPPSLGIPRMPFDLRFWRDAIRFHGVCPQQTHRCGWWGTLYEVMPSGSCHP